MAPEFTWIDARGRDITGTEAVSGYNVSDYFPKIETDTATDAELHAAYLGPDCDGIGVSWTA